LALSRHLTEIANWAGQISFRDLRRARALEESFVDLDLELGYRPTRAPIRKARGRRVSDLLRIHQNFVMLGDPGAGKTTSLKRLALGLIKESSGGDRIGYPLLIRLRDLGPTRALTSAILEIWGVSIKYDDALDAEAKENLRLRIVSQYLGNLSARLLIDGLDELHPVARDRVVRELRHLLLNTLNFSLIMTCRTGDFTFSFDNADVLVLEPLSDDQIRLFARKWLDQESADKLLLEVRGTPYGGSEVLPLTLAHLCAIYERTGSVPDKPRTVYRKIVRLLLEEWDEQRSIQRLSAYAAFEVDRKEEFLRAIAFHLTKNGRRGSFDEKHLESAYLLVCEAFGLPRNHSRQVAREIESHTGLIVEVTFESYEFAHKAIQEYLTAEYILRLPSHPEEITLAMPNETALATAMSSDSNHYFYTVVMAAVSTSVTDLSGFTSPLLRRLLLEKVDFKVDPTLGYAIITLYSESFFRSRGQLRLPFEVESDAFEEFLAGHVIRSSIRAALLQATSTQQPDGIWLVEWSDKSLKRQPCRLDQTFKRQAGLDDADFFGLQGEKPFRQTGQAQGLSLSPE